MLARDRAVYGKEGSTVKMKRTRGDVIFDAINVLIMFLFAMIVIYPLYLVLISSVSDPRAVVRGDVLFYPIDISFEGYKRLLMNKMILIGYRNTIVYTVFGTTFAVMLTMLAGYGLSRNFPGKKFFSLFVIFTMFFKGGMIPDFLLVRSIGLYDNPLSIIILNSMTIVNVFMARTVIRSTLPDELFDAASIDGCGHFAYFVRMVLPLSKALLGVLAVLYGVNAWNDYATGMIYIRNTNLQVFQVLLKDIITSVSTSATMAEMMSENDRIDLQFAMRLAESVKYAAIVISLAPMIVIYLSAQNFFTKGIMMGSMKG